jgi:hypothetical protein
MKSRLGASVVLMIAVMAGVVAAAAPAASDSGVVFDWTINVGNVLTMIAVIGSFTIWLVSGINARRDLVRDVGALKAEIKEVKEDIKSMSAVVVQLAEYDIRITNTDTNLARIQNEIDTLRRGEGFIFPIGRYTPPRNPGE